MKNIKKVLWEYRNRNSIESVFNDKMKLGFGFNRLPYKTDGSKEPDYDQINKIIDRDKDGVVLPILHLLF